MGTPSTLSLALHISQNSLPFVPLKVALSWHKLDFIRQIHHLLFGPELNCKNNNWRFSETIYTVPFKSRPLSCSALSNHNKPVRRSTGKIKLKSRFKSTCFSCFSKYDDHLFRIHWVTRLFGSGLFMILLHHYIPIFSPPYSLSLSLLHVTSDKC
jgi:hypothetical protein